MQPHAGQLVVAVSDHVSDGVEGVVQLDQQPLRPGVIESVHGHQVHVVEGEVLELGIDEIILLGVARHNVGQVEAVVHHGGPVQAEAQEAQEENHHDGFALGLEEQRGVFLPGEAGQVPVQEGEWDALLSRFGILHLGEEVPCGAGGRGEELGAVGVRHRGGGRGRCDG